MPEITIVLPFHDAGAWLEPCLDSIARQTRTDFEVLGIDDHSTDGSAGIFGRWSARDLRFRRLENPGRGIVAALAHGLTRASGSLIARMDADDLMDARRLEVQSGYLDVHDDVDLVGCRVSIVADRPVTGGMAEYVRWQNSCLDPQSIADEIYVESPFAHPSVMFRRDRVLELGGYREGPFPEDYDLWLRMAHAGCRMAKVEDELLAWRDRPDRLSRQDPRCARESFDRLRAHYLVRDRRLRLPGSAGRPVVFWGAGRRTRRRTRWIRAGGLEPVAWIDIDPRKIGNAVKGVPVVDPDWLRRPERPFVLGCVATHGARDQIADRLKAMDYHRGRDYLMVG